MSAARGRAREALKALVAEAHAHVVTSAKALAEYKGGTAVFNLERDRPLSDLAGFPVAVETLQLVPEWRRTSHRSLTPPGCRPRTLAAFPALSLIPISAALHAAGLASLRHRTLPT
jgi:hypothetical protein